VHFRQKGWLAIAKLRDAVKNYLAHFSAKGVLLKIKFVGNTEILKGGPLRSGLETSSTVVPLAMFKSKKTLPWFLRFYQRRSKRQTQTCSSTFCDRTRDYPTQSVLQQLLRKPEVSGQLFNNVFNSECVKPETNTRQFNINEDQLCRSRKKVIFPQKALNSENNWMFVVNVANFTQSVEIDECQGFGFGDGDDEVFGSCLYSGSQGNDPGSTSCRQLYRQHRLLALNGANKLEVDSFKLPSACACFTASNPFPEFRSSRPRQG